MHQRGRPDLGPGARRRIGPSGRRLKATERVDDASPRGAHQLRWILLGLDVVAVSAAWIVTLLIPGEFTRSLSGSGTLFAAEIALITITSVLVIASQRLYLARVCGVRAVETARLARASALSGVVAVLVAGQLATKLYVTRAALGALLTFALLLIARGFYGAWLRRGRANGLHCRPVVLVGAGAEAVELGRLLDQHPELGFRVAGVVGPAADVRKWKGTAVAGTGPFEDVLGVLERAHANGVIIATSDVPSETLNSLTRVLLQHEVHVHLSSGLRGIAHRRIRALPLAHEPLFYLERQSLAPWQRWIKRVQDVVLSTIMLVLLSPVLLASALAIKLTDRGPVFFRQTRIGRDGIPFTLLKLRTMVPYAEERLVDLTFANQRSGGPLFKLDHDPRRTKVGHLLERTSIDELPQFINVLRGEMSIVGPRPALPEEVEQFDDQLLDRQNVAPGITGLWQVEGRDNPAFDVYRRLDLFYVENWSVSLDLAVMFATVQAVLGRLVRLPLAVRRPRPSLDLTVVTGESPSTP